MMSFVYTLVFLKEKPAHTPRHAMDNNIMNHTNYNNKLITNNSSWDLEIPTAMAMEDNHFMNPHLHHHQIPNHNHHTTPLFPNYPPQYSSQSSCVDLPSNSALFLTTTTRLLEVHAEDNELVEEDDKEDLGAMKEMMYKIAAMQPVDIDPATIRRPRRRNVRISDDPQSVAARLRRERISERIRILQRLVPGGTKMDTASMLDEAIRYVKFLKRQIRLLQSNDNFSNNHHQLSSPLCAQEENNIINWGFGTSLPNKLGHGYIGNSYNTTSGSASGSWFAFAGGGCSSSSSSFDKA